MQIDQLYKENSLRTYSGNYINLLEPDPELILPIDIAIGLSRACRFAGHTKKFYSVAEHSEWCRHNISLYYPGETDLEFGAMMHDAHEFLLCDIPSPAKKLIPHYEDIAQKLQNAINKRFGVCLTHEQQILISDIDKEALEYEWNTKVLKFTGPELTEKVRVDLFMYHFNRLCKNSNSFQ